MFRKNKVYLLMGVVTFVAYFKTMQISACSCQADSIGDYRSPARHQITDEYAQKWGEPVGDNQLLKGEPVLLKSGNYWIQGWVHDNKNSDSGYSIILNCGIVLNKVSDEDLRRLCEPLSHLYQLPPTTHEFMDLLKKATKTLPDPPGKLGVVQAIVVPSESKIISTGDLHGDFGSLQTNIHSMYHKKLIDKNCRINPQTYFVCTGDYGDRGKSPIHVLAFLLRMKCENPNFFMLRGNHETEDLATMFSLEDDIACRYGQEGLLKVWPLLMDLFRRLPQALLISSRFPDTNRYRIGCWCHAGIEERLTLLFQYLIQKIITQNLTKGSSTCETDYFDLTTDNGLLWSDFYAKIFPKLLVEPGKGASRRGASGVYDYDKSYMHYYLKNNFSVKKLMYEYDMNVIVRGHSHIPGGIVMLRDELKGGQHWDKLESEKPFEVEPYSVFTHTSSELGQQNCEQDAFSVIGIQKNGKWFMTPHIQEIPPWSIKF